MMLAALSMRLYRVCYTGNMFIHRIFITGCSDRGAWPWRTRTVSQKHCALNNA